MKDTRSSWFSRIGLPLKVGVAFALVAMLLALVGVARGIVPAKPLSIFLALVISGASWGVVSWAVATAVVDVEREVGGGEDDRSEKVSNGEAGPANDK
jgi:hypothetical protein